MELTVLILFAGSAAYVALIWCLTPPVPEADPNPFADAGPYPEWQPIDTRWNVLYAGYVVALTALGVVAWPAFIDWHFSRLPQGLFLLGLVQDRAAYIMGGFIALALAFPAAYTLASQTLRLNLGKAEFERYWRHQSSESTVRRQFLLRAAIPGFALTGLMCWVVLTGYTRFEEDRVVVSNQFGLDGASYRYDQVKYVVQSEWVREAKGHRSFRHHSVRSVRWFVVFDDRRVVSLRADAERLNQSDVELVAFVLGKSGKPLTEVSFSSDVSKLP